MIIRINLVLNLLVFRQSLKAIIYRQFHHLTMPSLNKATRCRILLLTVTFRLSLQNILKEIIKSRYTLLAKTLSHKHWKFKTHNILIIIMWMKSFKFDRFIKIKYKFSIFREKNYRKSQENFWFLKMFFANFLALIRTHFTDNSVFCAKNSSEVTFDNGGNHISTIIK